MKKRTFWLRVQEAMTDAGMKPTQKAAGALIGIAQSSVHKWTTGGLPMVEHCVALAIKLHVSVEWLYSERGPKHPMDAESTALLNAFTALRNPKLRERALAYVEGLGDLGPPETPTPARPRLS